MARLDECEYFSSERVKFNILWIILCDQERFMPSLLYGPISLSLFLQPLNNSSAVTNRVTIAVLTVVLVLGTN